MSMTDEGASHLKRNIEILLLVILAAAITGFAFFTWRRGSDRAACILNIRNVQQAVRAHVNVRGLTTPATAGSGAALASTEIVGTGKYLNTVSNPVAGTLTYAYLEKVPAIGELYLTVTGDTDNEYSPTAGSTSEW